MIQAQKDANGKEQKSEQEIPSSSTPRTVTAAAVRTVHVDPRRSAYVASTLGSPTTVILSEGGSLPESGAYQYHRVALGTQLQHVVTPVQVAGTNSTVVSDSSISVNPRCVVTSSQDLAHILVAVTTTSALHSLERQTVTVSSGTHQQAQTIGTIANVVTSNQRTAGGTILAQSVPQTSMPQRIVLNSGMSDVFLRLSPSTGASGSSPQFMVLESASGLVPSSDVTKVHSYSLASAAVSALSSSCNMQKVVISTQGKHLQGTGLPHKAILTTPAHTQIRTGTKRLASVASSRSDTLSSVNTVTDIVSRFALVNKLLSGLISSSDGRIPSIPGSPKSKKMKLDKPLITKDISKRKKIMDHFTKKLRLLKCKYYHQQAEYFFLKSGGNIMDHLVWKKKLPTELLEYLRANKFDSYDDVKVITECLSRWYAISNTASGFPGEQVQLSKSSNASSSHPQSPSSRVFSSPSRPMDSSSSPSKNCRPSMVTQKQLIKQSPISSVYDSQIGSQEEIVERAKQEAYVMQKVGDLRKEGLWSLKRLPKVAEVPRIKAHWDYLLEEMVWLATDFAQERKWKKAAAKKCARMITKYFQEKEIKAEKAEKEEQMRLRKIASFMAREIKTFWNNIEKLVEYKQQTWLEEKRKKVLDTHLNFIVDQTEKYSSWLTQGMNRGANDSPDSSRPNSPMLSSVSSASRNKHDFQPESSGSDDEETINKEEEDLDENEQNEEIKLLQKESQMSLEDFLDTLPPEILNESVLSDSKAQDSAENQDADKSDPDHDEDYEASGDEEDDEQTILEQEKVEIDVDHEKEIAELEAENELSLEELKRKYAVADMPKESEDDSEDDEELSSEEEEDVDNDRSDSLPQNHEDKSEPSKAISDIAAEAEVFQPKGNTFSTTQVCTKVPFLLKHKLREYQHIGLDWMNAMYDKKLNGILADEMGLGKTIQTISVLAHLACEKGVWGPHLIVVPTSVMLNWEMEFKKWCPAFKILTYYGTPKERKLKRVGWTKPNAFHVCITSYKLVVQDHQSFRRKRWKYLILDEAQHIKNFKSQRWQMLLNFQSTHRLLLTGTPLQNNLMELWSLMHFLMPNVFQSNKEFKEWFVNPVTGMIEGSHEYNDSIIKRLHKVLRPFLLRRLKCEVEKQLPKKYEHVIVCRLSKRQRYLYDDFMSQTKTKETLATGNFMSVINILMQLRKVCNHPNMFEERPTVSSFLMEGIKFVTASLVNDAIKYDPYKHVSLCFLNLLLADLEILLTAYAAHRVKKFQTPPKLIVELDNMPEPPPPCPSVKLKVNFCNSQAADKSSHVRPAQPAAVRPATPSRVLSSPTSNPSQRLMVIPGQPGVARAVNPVSAINQTVGVPGEQQYTLQLVQPGTAVASLSPLGGLTLQLQSNSPGVNRFQSIQSLIGGIGRMVQTAGGAQWLITSVGNSLPEQQQLQTTVTTTVASQPTATTTTTTIQPLVIGTNIATATVMPQVNKAGNSISSSFITSFSRPPINNSSPASSSANQATHNKPVGRVAPLNVHPPTTSNSGPPTVNHVQPVNKSPVVHSLSKPVVKTGPDSCDKSTSLFYLESLAQKRGEARKEKLKSLARINSRRCTAYPIYGGDLVDTISFVNRSKHSVEHYKHKWGGYLNSEHQIFSEEDPALHLHTTRALAESIKTAAERMINMMDIIKRFVFVVPAVSSPSVELHLYHPSPSTVNEQSRKMEVLEAALSPVCTFFHPLVSNMKTQFPELRLIEYDCGKLQRLALLLRDLKKEHHRVLIFTQMTRMLDILEQFLNYHGHTYLRLDGNTKVEQRQALMERFNADQRIFCFILSTRSGGIGVNLTGADTVIFYDSDWNPTMDAQAQDRCHRIGQTRDVHIYRLISDRTVEENILKKANQKRLLGDLAIEGGNFNTAFFKKNTIQDLFDIEVQEDPAKVSDDKSEVSKEEKEESENFSQTQLEQALGMAEEETDLEAAKTAHAEAAAEFAEFDESIPLDNDSRENEEKSPAEEELEKLMEQLTPVEKYAVQFLESLQEPLSLEQLKLAEEEIEAQKKDWELGHLKALKEEEEKRLGFGDEDSLLFCSRDSSNQIYYSENGQEEMPTWAPPTPPTSENDIYLDPCLAFWYEPSVMHESRLPPVFIKKEPKRQHVDPVVSASTTTRKQKVRKDDMVNIPRSLFDRPSAAILKMRREVKLQKVKGLMVGASSLSKPVPTFAALKQTPIVVSRPTPDVTQDKSEWLISEDYSILQVIQDQQGIPLSLTILMPGHTPNWDLAADAVNGVSRVYRSARNCKSRFENVIMLREEGKIVYDNNPKKPKKTKGIYKTKNNRPMKTSHLYQQDSNAAYTSIFLKRCKGIVELAQKRKAQAESVKIQTQTQKIPKGLSVLNDCGINYDEPLSPMEIASNRQERIQREKQKNQPAGTQSLQSAVATAQVPAQTVVQVAEHPSGQRQVQQQSTVTVTGAASLIPHQAQAVIASLAQAQQLQQVQLSKANLQPGSAVAATLAKSLTSSIMVNTSPGTAAGTFATITKALGQAGVSSISAQGAVQNAAIAAALSNATNLRNQRTTGAVSGTTTTTMTVQEMVAAAAAAGQVRLTTSASGTSSAPAVVSVAGLATVQLAAASQRITGTAATTVATAVANQMNSQITTQRNITQLSQIQAIRQTALIRQREQQTLKQQQQLKRLHVQQQQAASQPGAKVAVGAAGAAALTVAAGQQRVAPQQVTMKQSRPLTDAEMTQFVKRQQLQQQQKVQLTTAQILAQAQLQQVQPQQVSITGGTATLVKTVSAPSSVAIPVSAVTMGSVNINVSLPQGKSGVQTKGATTITNQQLRQLQIQQQLLNQARKGSKVTTNLTQLAKVPNKGSGMTTASISAPVNAVQIVQHNPAVGNSQQVKGLPTAMTVQQIQQAMKAMPQNLPVVVTATPSLPGIQHTATTLRGEPGVVASSVKAQTTTLPSTTLTTSNVLKGTPAVVVGQQQTAAILQQVAASSAGITGQHAVTLAVRATASQAQGQQVQIQVQPSAHSSLVTPQAQVVTPQTRIQQLSQNASTINIAPPVAVQSVPQASSILSPSGTIVQQMPADSTIQSSTHVVMHTVAITNTTPTNTALSSPQTTSVQAVIQAARQQQAAAQQQKASPYTMRLRNPPK